LFLYSGGDNVKIDLRAATLNMNDGMLAGGGISSAEGIYGGYTIANGVEIENATSGRGNDLLQGNTVANVLKGNAGNDTLLGSRGKDTLRGGVDKDVLKGGKGKDDLIGGKGKDKLTGGKGNDTLEGNKGVDKFIFKTGDGNDTVTDFQDGIDLIKITGGANSFADLIVTQSGADTVITFSNVSVTLENIAASDITADDFIF
ncbi:MAG: M10 family metallopeptidase C-terminal domain-containing protein, partial [Alphaproteobacteria bacterium]